MESDYKVMPKNIVGGTFLKILLLFLGFLTLGGVDTLPEGWFLGLPINVECFELFKTKKKLEYVVK